MVFFATFAADFTIVMKRLSVKLILSLSLVLMTGFLFVPLQAQRIALKTNALTYTMLAPSLGLEMLISRHSTIDVQAYVSATPKDFAYPGFFGAGFSPEYRYWLVRPQYGHFIGGAFNYFYADLSPKSFLVNEYTKAFGFSIGPSYGYSWILDDRWSIEANVSVGYQFLRTWEYTLPDQPEIVHHLPGLVRLGLSIVYIVK